MPVRRPSEHLHIITFLARQEEDPFSTIVAHIYKAEARLKPSASRIWANLEELRKLLLAMLDAVYVDAKEEKRILAIKPKPPFRPVFQVATAREGPGVVIMKEPPESHPGAPCFWWRRGRVEITSSIFAAGLYPVCV